MYTVGLILPLPLIAQSISKRNRISPSPQPCCFSQAPLGFTQRRRRLHHKSNRRRQTIRFTTETLPSASCPPRRCSNPPTPPSHSHGTTVDPPSCSHGTTAFTHPPNSTAYAFLPLAVAAAAVLTANFVVYCGELDEAFPACVSIV